MPVTRQTQASSSQNIPQAPEPTKALQSVVLRYEKHQDAIVVNSAEEESYGLRSTGVKHYLHMLHRLGLDAKPSLDHIDYRNLEGLQRDTTAPDTFEDAVPPLPALGPPEPPPSPANYNQPIFSGTTHNPAVFLSILRIAQQNLPFLNLTSALNHIPNIRANDLMPRLHPAAPGNLAPQSFLDKELRDKRADDVDINIAFLPDFYNGGETHALGYFHILTDPLRGRVVGACLFTPCSEEDLRRYGLVEYLISSGGDGVESMSSVGCWKGAWLDKDTVEEWDEWKLIWRVAGRTWEGRLGLSRGDTEG